MPFLPFPPSNLSHGSSPCLPLTALKFMAYFIIILYVYIGIYTYKLTKQNTYENFLYTLSLCLVLLKG